MKLIIWDFRNTLYDIDSDDYVEGAIDILGKFKKKYKQILISSTHKVESRIKLIQKLGIDRYFNDIIIAPKTKALFINLINKYAQDPSEVYIVGDMHAREIVIGNELGAKTIWLRHPDKEHNEEFICWHSVVDLSEIEKLID